MVPDPERTLAEGAVAPWSTGHTAEYFTRMMAGLGDALGFDVDTPWRKLPAKARKAIMQGHNHKVTVSYTNRFGRTRTYSTGFEGVIPWIERRHAEAESDSSREKHAGYMREAPCPACHGTRLKPLVLAATLGGETAGEYTEGGRSIAEVAAMPVGECAEFLRNLKLGTREAQIAARVLKEVNEIGRAHV